MPIYIQKQANINHKRVDIHAMNMIKERTNSTNPSSSRHHYQQAKLI